MSGALNLARASSSTSYGSDSFLGHGCYWKQVFVHKPTEHESQMYWFNRVFVPALKRRISMVSNLPDILYGAVKPFLGFTADGTGRRGVIFCQQKLYKRSGQLHRRCSSKATTSGRALKSGGAKRHFSNCNILSSMVCRKAAVLLGKRDRFSLHF